VLTKQHKRQLQCTNTTQTQGDQKVSVHLTITVQSLDAQRLFDHSV